MVNKHDGGTREKSIMQKRRVLLVSVHPLLSEGLVNVLGKMEDVVLIGPRAPSNCTLFDVRASAPDVVLFAAEKTDDPVATALLVQILQHMPILPVIQIGLAGNTAIRVYTSRILPASSTNLIGIIRKIPIQCADETAEKDSKLEE
ncbi:MAG: DNA-binding response regulator [Chloroflexi bacterium]|nr:MAG: DNA-binding response regulator [Chloroflexota bacterium]